MEAERYIQLLCLLHGGFYKSLIQDRDTIIGKACCPCFPKRLHIGQFFSCQPFCDAGTAFHMNSCLSAFFQHIGQGFLRIDRRLCICHQHNRGKTTGRCCTRTCFNILFMRKARISEMHMYIHKTRPYLFACCVYDPQ